MKEFKLDYHAPYCEKQHMTGWYEDIGITPHKYCERNVKNFLFLLNNDFILINYHLCVEGNHIDFKKSLIEDIIKNNKIYELYDVRKSMNLNKEFRNFRYRDAKLRTKHTQVNYIYCDNAGKDYAITTETGFIDALCDQDLLRDNYKSALNYIRKNSMPNWMEDQLINLYRCNYIGMLDNVEIIKTVDHLIKQINNGNNKESKQQRVA